MRVRILVPMALILLLGCEQATLQLPATDAGFADGGTDATMDAGATDTGVSDTGVVQDRCLVEPGFIQCTHNEATVSGTRKLYWQVPWGPAPAAGWPVVFMFHGSLVVAEASWTGREGDALGFYYQAQTLWMLLSAGYAVITPVALVSATQAWTTNIPPWSVNWESSPDHQYMLNIFDSITRDAFGPLNTSRMFAMGLSSGGYMTSRMAVSYPGRFKALAIQSASYATCAGALCVVPSLPTDHPPTLFLHGERDAVVPITTARSYYQALQNQGTVADMIVDPQAGHEWIWEAPEGILEWFERH